MIEPGNPVQDISIGEETSIDKIFEKMSKSGGFESRNLADGLSVLAEMINEKECISFLSFVGAIISTGLRGIIKDMIEHRWFDVIITTCGALDHDIARHFSNYNEGSFTLDDAELNDADFHRLGNVLVPMDSYGPLIEKKMQMFLEEEYNNGTREMSTEDVCKMIGKHLGDDSFLHSAYKNDVKVIVPGIMDGAVGSQIWLFAQKHSDFKLNIIKDADTLSGIIFKAKKSGALMIGGGISKHHTIWWNQFRDGLDYAVQVTTAPEWDGSLSGARVREAVSWGKVRPKARRITVEGDATVLLPLILGPLL